MSVSPFISWSDAPDEPIEQALYRINQLENRFIEHIYQNDIRQQFLLNLIKSLVLNKKIAVQDIDFAITQLKEQNQEHLRNANDGSTMEQDFINDIIAELQQLHIGIKNQPHEPN